MFRLTMALAILIASTGLSTAAFAQNDHIPRDAVQGYQVRPEVRPADRFGNAVDFNRQGPRFIVEAVSYKAVNESDYDYPYTSDEIFAVFTAGGNMIVTSNTEQVDTGDLIRFPSHQRCIFPAIDPDNSANRRWACDPAGRRGPIEFTVALIDDDWEVPLFAWDFCSPNGGRRGNDLADCTTTEFNDTVFEHTFRYEVSDIVQRLNPSCRCFTQTARQSVDDQTTYEFTFRITMVDGGNDMTILDPGTGAVGERPVHRMGSLEADLNQRFEFDAGTVVAANGDFVFTRSNNQFFLTPNAGARIWLGNATARGYAACAAGAANHVTTAVQVPAAGTHACYITSDGRVGELRITELRVSPFGGTPVLSLSYTTWQ